MNVSQKLLDKYNVPVPRYTSYPPANYFTDKFKADDFSKILKLSNIEEPNHIGFYIHIPFCAQICYYCGCNATQMQDSKSVKTYVDAVKKEIKLIAQHIDKSRKISQIHYGGGTPNAIKAEYLEEINQLLFSEFGLIDDAEIAIECNPALLNYSYLDKLLEAKFNRFSFGIQDFNEDVLEGVNRRPSAIPVKELVKYIKSKNNNIAINLDFIYGLPGQTLDSFTKTIQQAIQIKPDRLVTFSYAHVPWLKENQKILEEKGLPSAKDKMDMFLKAYSLLLNAGYISIGLDHYALPGDELSIALNQQQLHRNFQGYCTKRTTGQVYAVGISGINQLSGGYAQNTKNINEYIGAINNGTFPIEKGYIVNQQEQIIRMVINELMCNKRVKWADVANSFQVNEDDIKETIAYNEQKLKDFEADGLIRFDNTKVEITETGTLFIRNIVASLDPVLTTNGKRYSKSL
jgi:oxygen-independent coproporphyrinogen-3 oxidase